MAATAVLQPDSSYFFERLAQTKRGLLILDYDNTIAPLCCPRPWKYFRPTVTEVLDSILTTTQTRLILITTRPASDLMSSLGVQPHPEIWGSDGRLLPNGYCDTAASSDLSSWASALSQHVPVAHLPRYEIQGNASAGRASLLQMLVRPQLYLSNRPRLVGAPEGMLEFLTDWLYACGGEMG